MKLVNFSVTNFRSITKAHKIAISNSTILIGKNNEGKSNILKALNIAMNALKQHAFQEKRGYRMMRRPYRQTESIYNWKRDFPINIQSRVRNTQSIFRLEFELTESEIAEFRTEIKSLLNGTLPIEIRISKDNEPSIKIVKKGRGGKTLSAKSGKIATFVGKKILFNYIPAVRTDQEAISVVREMLSFELRSLEKEKEYNDALSVIKSLQEPILTALAAKIKEPLKEFLPNIKDVIIDVSDYERRVALRRDFDIIVDDGTPTNIEFKGDGVKSLAALGLLKNKTMGAGTSIIAIEEPESHLHPSAIHQLKNIIIELSHENQIIITSHNPLFVDRKDIKSNIIIDQGKAKPAKNIQEIRELLGVKASDNLVNANYVLVVEGEEDVIALKALLPSLSEKIAKHLSSNILIIDHIGGAGNLSYKLSLYSNALCESYVLLDNDEAGRTAYEKAEDDGILQLKRCTFINCAGMTNSEFEDCLNVDIYKEQILNEFDVNLDIPRFRGNTKWSDRVKKLFTDCGKPWSSKIEAQVKHIVAKSIKGNLENALNEHKRNSIDALVQSLERLIKS